jgi:predicted exporter
MKAIRDLVSRRWLTFYGCGLCSVMFGLVFALLGSSVLYVLLALGVVVMFCVLILAEWRGLE